MSESKATPSWSRRLRYRLEHAALCAVVWFIPKLPLRLVRWAAAVLGTLAWLGDVRGRRTGMENLRAALGPSLSTAQRRRILRASYRGFARTFLDLFWSQRIKPEHWDRYFILQCDTEAARAAAERNHCLYVAPHFTGFECLNIAMGLRFPNMAIAQNFKNPALAAIFASLRSAGGRQAMIPQEGAVLRIFRQLKKGGSASALVDLKVNVLRDGTPLKSFGMMTSATAFHCALAQRTGVPIVPFMSLPAPDGRLIVRFCDPLTVAPDEDLRAATQRCWAVFEQVIRAQPQVWMWMYKHWRYLPDGADAAAYPAYAQKLQEFDDLLRRGDQPS